MSVALTKCDACFRTCNYQHRLALHEALGLDYYIRCKLDGTVMMTASADDPVETVTAVGLGFKDRAERDCLCNAFSIFMVSRVGVCFATRGVRSFQETM
jgi:hypothetical protein